MYSQNQPINPRLILRPPFGPGPPMYGDRPSDSSILSNFMKNGRAAASGSWSAGSNLPISTVLREEYGHPPSEYVWSNQFSQIGNKKYPNRAPIDSVARELQHRSFPTRRWNSETPQRGWKNYEGQGLFQRAPNITSYPATKINKSIEEVTTNTYLFNYKIVIKKHISSPQTKTLRITCESSLILY